MPTATDALTTLERRAWRSTFDDGLVDLLLGAMLLLNWIGSLVSHSRILYPFFFGLIGVFWVLKWRVVIPRAGVARFGPVRRQRKLIAALVLLAATIAASAVTAVMMTHGALAAWMRAHPAAFEAGFPALVVAVFSALAVLLDVARIHVIGLAVALGFGVDLWLGSGIGFLVGGALVSLAGGVRFVGFLRSHPRLSSDAGNAEHPHG